VRPPMLQEPPKPCTYSELLRLLLEQELHFANAGYFLFAYALLCPFRLGDFHFFLRLSLRWSICCGGSFAAKPHSHYI
jgi:hypothetical protein